MCTSLRLYVYAFFASRIWPKFVWITVFEEQGEVDPNNVHVISYRRKHNEQVEYGVDAKPLWSGVGPMQSLRNVSYRNLEEYAHVIVEHSPSTDRFDASLQTDPVSPSWWRHHRSSFIAGGLLLGGLLLALRRPARSAALSSRLRTRTAERTNPRTPSPSS
jgi:hypothetical protein